MSSVRDLKPITNTEPKVTKKKRQVKVDGKPTGKTEEYYEYSLHLLNPSDQPVEVCYSFYYITYFNIGGDNFRGQTKRICSGRVTVPGSRTLPLGSIVGGAFADCESKDRPPDGATILCVIDDWKEGQEYVPYGSGLNSKSVVYKKPRKVSMRSGEPLNFGSRFGFALVGQEIAAIEAVWSAPLGWAIDFPNEEIIGPFPTEINYTITPSVSAEVNEFARLELSLVSTERDEHLRETIFLDFVVEHSPYSLNQPSIEEAEIADELPKLVVPSSDSGKFCIAKDRQDICLMAGRNICPFCGAPFYCSPPKTFQ